MRKKKREAIIGFFFLATSPPYQVAPDGRVVFKGITKEASKSNAEVDIRECRTKLWITGISIGARKPTVC